MVANGISSHCVDFCHERRRPCGCHMERCEPCRDERCEPPRAREIHKLRAQVKSLQAGARRFTGQEQPEAERAKRREVHDPEAVPPDETSSEPTEGQD